MQDIGTLGSWTEAVAVNGSGQILAWSTTPSVFSRAVVVDRLGFPQDLGTLAGGQSRAVAINDNGRVVGDSLTPSGFTHAFFWKEGNMQDLGSIGQTHSQAIGINSKDEVIARTGQFGGDAIQPFFWSKKTGQVPIPGLGGFRWDAAAINNNSQVAGWSFTSNGHVHAFLWSPSGGPVDLAPGATFDSWATAINDDGTVIGYRYSENNERGFGWYWKPGTGMVDLPDLGGQFTFVWAINKLGWIAGESDNPATYQRSGIIWKNGQVIELGTLGGGSARPRAINTNGVAVGVSDLSEWPPSHAFSGASAPLRDLGVVFESHQFSDARSINDIGEIVGVSSDTDTDSQSSRAFLVRGAEAMIHLGTLGGNKSEAWFVNALGQVVGRAETARGDSHATLWTTR
jgi:probable HAF family extracellular repeat protein